MSAPNWINDADAAILADRLNRMSDRGRQKLLGWITAAMGPKDARSQQARALVCEFLAYFNPEDLEGPRP